MPLFPIHYLGWKSGQFWRRSRFQKRASLTSYAAIVFVQTCRSSQHPRLDHADARCTLLFCPAMFPFRSSPIPYCLTDGARTFYGTSGGLIYRLPQGILPVHCIYKRPHQGDFAQRETALPSPLQRYVSLASDPFPGGVFGWLSFGCALII